MASIGTLTLTFGVVSAQVKLYSTAFDPSYHFNLLHQACGNRINMQNFCQQCDKVLERSEIIKGYEYEKGKYVTLSQEDFDMAKLDKSETLEITSFVRLAEVDPMYFDKSYYLAATAGSEKALGLLTEAMESMGVAAVGQFVLRSREYVAVIRRSGRNLILHTLVYQPEIQENEHPLHDLDFNPKEQLLAKKLVSNMIAPFNPGDFSDSYNETVGKIIQAKIDKTDMKSPAARPRQKVADLMEALQASVEATTKKKTKKAS